MVCFIDGKPAKKEYRKYRIRTVSGPNDVETMREVIRRRYTRVLKENRPLPDLVLVDGGKAQIHAAVDVLENELGLFIPVGGMVKDDKHQTAKLMAGDPVEEVKLERRRRKQDRRAGRDSTSAGQFPAARADSTRRPTRTARPDSARSQSAR